MGFHLTYWMIITYPRGMILSCLYYTMHIMWLIVSGAFSLEKYEKIDFSGWPWPDWGKTHGWLRSDLGNSMQAATAGLGSKWRLRYLFGLPWPYQINMIQGTEYIWSDRGIFICWINGTGI